MPIIHKEKKLVTFKAATKDHILSYNCSLISQGKHRFFTFSMPIDILSHCCFVSSREEDPILGFQRVLDTKRAQDIAAYIDSGQGVIPNSIVLSAQKESDFSYDSKRHTVSFKNISKAFLVLDGQHRIYGFSMTSTNLRVPVVIFNDLSRIEEARLFIDINTKQRPVPNELLLDIKRLADNESEEESFVRDIFDLFKDESDSCLKGMMTSSTRVKGKISRVTFKKAIRPILPLIMENDAPDVYKALNFYLLSFKQKLQDLAHNDKLIANPTIISAAFLLFPEVSSRVTDKYSILTTDNFSTVLSHVFKSLKGSNFSRPGNSPRRLYDVLIALLRSESIHFKFQ